MSLLQTQIATNTWVPSTWEEYIQVTDDPAYAKAKGYYDNGRMRIETVGVGPAHASVNTLIIFAINLYCTLLGVPLQGLTNCSYRQTGVREVQPDISYYFGDRAQLAPQGSAIADLATVPPPDLAIEIADSSLNDDLGQKRLLYEDLAISEYWVVDVENRQTLAFEIADGGSRRITESKVLPGLAIAVLRQALEMSREMNQAQVGAWLLTQFQQQ
ncbi:MAG TPA: Uma2 family endonuclease [Allocoleopsis sp.]